MTAMNHVRYLAGTIGPRGSTTSQEAEAARYAAQVLRDAGLEPVIEPFTSARSAWYPYALFSGLVLLSELLYWIGGRWGAIAGLTLASLALVSVLLELAFRPNPLRWLLPKGHSQNVWARLEPTGGTREQVVLLGHLNTHRTPLVFSTDRWLKLFKSLVPTGLVSSVLLVVALAVGIAAGRWLWRTSRLPPRIPLRASREPPEALRELPNIEIAMPRKLFKGRASRGVEDASVPLLTDDFAATTPSRQEQSLIGYPL